MARATSPSVEPSAAFRAAVAAYDLANAMIAGYGPAFRGADHAEWIEEQLAKRRRYFADIAARLGLDPERAAELLKGRDS